MNENSCRIESDFIGELWIPEAALYGIQSFRGAENFSSSGRAFGDKPALVRGLAEIKNP